MTEYAYTQNNNEIIVEFQEAGVAKNLSAAAKIMLQLFAKKSAPIDRVDPVKSWDTVADAALFITTQLSTGKLTFKPDSTALTNLTASTYYGRFVVFSVDYPLGIVWMKGADDLFTFVIGK